MKVVANIFLPSCPCKIHPRICDLFVPRVTQSPIGKGSRSWNFRKEENRPYTELRTVNCITSTEIAENTGLEKERKKTQIRKYKDWNAWKGKWETRMRSDWNGEEMEIIRENGNYKNSGTGQAGAEGKAGVWRRGQRRHKEDLESDSEPAMPQGRRKRWAKPIQIIQKLNDQF